MFVCLIMDAQELASPTEAVRPELNRDPKRGARGTVGTRRAWHYLSSEFVVQHQRARIIHGLADEIADRGYREVTVADIVKRAGVARNTFYANFGSKEECFLAASDLAGEEAMRRVAEAIRNSVPKWGD